LILHRSLLRARLCQKLKMMLTRKSRLPLEAPATFL
jgi:hypothetical protein